MPNFVSAKKSFYNVFFFFAFNSVSVHSLSAFFLLLSV